VCVLTVRHGRRIRREENKGRIRQAGEQLGLWLRQGVLPLSYYLFELYRDTPRWISAGGPAAVERRRMSSVPITDSLVGF